MKTTIVSAFISNSNNRTDRTVKDYFELARPLLELNHPKIIFIESKYKDLIKFMSHSTTQIILFERNELDFFEEISSGHFQLPEYRNFEKDTIEYLHLMSNKTLFCKKAIELSQQISDNFIWLDFGISHILQGEPISSLIKTSYQFNPNKIRIGGIWSDETSRQYNLFKQINWFFAGGVFGGTANSLLTFYYESRSQFIKNLSENKITWEVNMWRQIYERDPNIFEIYKSNHDQSLILNL
jgi:hypothetical protein